MINQAFILAVTAVGQTFPPVQQPLNLAMSSSRIEVGRKLYFDTRLSQNNTVACATCHHPQSGFSDGKRVAQGIFFQNGQFNSPTTLFSGHRRTQFWNGRTTGLENQALQPLVNRVEMGNQSVNQVINRLRRIPGYTKIFQEAYGKEINRANFGHALASFQSTLISTDAPIDRRMRGENALSQNAEKGYQIFQAANCMECHIPPLFSDNSFHNTGISIRFRDGVDSRFDILSPSIRKTTDIRAFKTPSLREIARTAPYTHSGALPELKNVVDHYSSGGYFLNSSGNSVRDRFIDPRIRRLNLTSDEKESLVVFLRTAFQGENYPNVSQPQMP